MTCSMTAIDTHPDHTIDGQKGRKATEPGMMRIYQFISEVERARERNREKVEKRKGKPKSSREGPECQFLHVPFALHSRQWGEEIAVHKE